MCRYAYKIYKYHYVCFDCRKSFKEATPEDLAKNSKDWSEYNKAFLRWDRKKFVEAYPEKVEYLERTYRNRQFKCPECNRIMANLGLDFKAPKKEKIKEWKILRGIYKLGHSFSSCGCDGPGFIPKDKNEYVEYLQKRKKLYQKNLNSRKEDLEGEELKSYLSYWANLIERLDLELKRN